MNSNRFAWIANLAAILLAASVAGCGKSPAPAAKVTHGDANSHAQVAEEEEQADPTLTAVTLQLNWFPEAEHGGYFAALVHGYYREAGLNVRILPGGADTPVVQQVAGRAVTFGIINADKILFGRAAQAPVVAVMAPLQVSPRCLIVHKSSGIKDFDDLKNMTLAMSNVDAFANYLRYKLPLPGVKIVPYAGNVAQFLIDKHYAQQGYVFSEPFVARKKGGDPKVLMVSDMGFNPYTSVLITHDDQLEEHASIVRKMVASSVRGWEKYLEEPRQANERIHKMNPEMDLDVLAYGAETLKPLVMDAVAEQRGVGIMTRARWQALSDQLVESKQLKPAQADIAGAFTNRFLRPEERDASRPQTKRE